MEVKKKNRRALVKYVDTICRPTRERQLAVKGLLKFVEILVVVGGRNSNNTKQLASLATRAGKPSLHVESADELDVEALRSFSTVGLAAGTSTSDSTILAVENRLKKLAQEINQNLLEVTA